MGGGGGPLIDPEEEARKEEVFAKIEEDMKEIRKGFDALKLKMEVSLGQVTNKVDTHVVKDLDEKVDKNVKTMTRDINMSKKKLNRLVHKTNKLEK